MNSSRAAADLTWPEVRVTTWQAFVAALEEALDGYRDPPTYVFRGQADASWPLLPSLARRLRHAPSRSAAHEIERHIEEQFRSQAALFPETMSAWPFLSTLGRTEAWAFMQHHSCATRLLDWSASAHVAAYFAVCELPDTDGALYLVAPAAIDQYIAETRPAQAAMVDDYLVDEALPDRVTFLWPTLRSSRLVAQQGQFSVSTNILDSHDRPILEACVALQREQPRAVIARKIVIERDLKLVILQQLRAMNVAPHALFPNIDGLGRSLSDLANLKAILSRPANPPLQPTSEEPSVAARG